MRKKFLIYSDCRMPINGNARAVIAKNSPKYVQTTAAALRLEEPFVGVFIQKGSCTWCSKTARRKMVQTNQGLIALCLDCIHKAKSYRGQFRIKLKRLRNERKPE